MTTEVKQQMLPEIFSLVTAIAYGNPQDRAKLPRIFELITALAADNSEFAVNPEKQPVEMLTIKECAQLVQGVSEHTIRKLAKQDKIKYVRAGEGKRGKMLINKDSMVEYFGI